MLSKSGGRAVRRINRSIFRTQERLGDRIIGCSAYHRGQKIKEMVLYRIERRGFNYRFSDIVFGWLHLVPVDPKYFLRV